MSISWLASEDDSIASAALWAFLEPALRTIAAGPLRRARHGNGMTSCRPEFWCHDCEEDLHEIFLASHRRLHDALWGDPPQTRDGSPVREIMLVAAHISGGDAEDEEIEPLARRLALAPAPDEPGWLRAARAQLVHYPVRHLEPATRRRDAVRNGGSARPDRDLATAAWAAPLRADPVTLDLLAAFIGRLRHGAPDPYAMPTELLDRHGLTGATARRHLVAALQRLHAIRPDFYAANVTAQLPYASLDGPDVDERPSRDLGPEAGFAVADDRRRARVRLREALDPARPGGLTRRGLAARLCGPAPATALVLAADLGLAAPEARALIADLVRLVAAAGLDWTADLLSS